MLLVRINTAGVIPIIFASSIMSFPGIIATFMGRQNAGGAFGQVLAVLSENNWFDIHGNQTVTVTLPCKGTLSGLNSESLRSQLIIESY